MLPSASAPSPEGATSGAARFLAGGAALGGATGGAGSARAAFAAGRRAPCFAGLFGLRGRSDSGRSSSLSLAVPVTGSERWARRGVPKNARGLGQVCASARRVRGVCGEVACVRWQRGHVMTREPALADSRAALLRKRCASRCLALDRVDHRSAARVVPGYPHNGPPATRLNLAGHAGRHRRAALQHADLRIA